MNDIGQWRIGDFRIVNQTGLTAEQMAEAIKALQEALDLEMRKWRWDNVLKPLDSPYCPWPRREFEFCRERLCECFAEHPAACICFDEEGEDE